MEEEDDYDYEDDNSIINSNSNNINKYESGVVGIKNIGNTCYINSMLQCLSHSNDLIDFFVNRLGINETSDEKYCVFIYEYIYILIVFIYIGIDLFNF